MVQPQSFPTRGKGGNRNVHYFSPLGILIDLVEGYLHTLVIHHTEHLELNSLVLQKFVRDDQLTNEDHFSLVLTLSTSPKTNSNKDQLLPF